MVQSWHNLLFAHWPIDPAKLRPLIPKQLALDTFDGQAWLGIVSFYMTGVRLRWIPALPGLSSFPELNVRTYVTAENKPGVWFFSLDAANSLAVAAARATFHLSYFTARMQCEEKDGWVNYLSERRYKNAPAASLNSKYRAKGDVFEAHPGSLGHFLTERYCLYSAPRDGRVFRGEIHHPPWRLQSADAVFTRNTMAESAGVNLPEKEPLLHFARMQNMVAWAPRPIA
jgi:uncharacterized protein